MAKTKMACNGRDPGAPVSPLLKNVQALGSLPPTSFERGALQAPGQMAATTDDTRRSEDVDVSASTTADNSPTVGFHCKQRTQRVNGRTTRTRANEVLACATWVVDVVQLVHDTWVQLETQTLIAIWVVDVVAIRPSCLAYADGARHEQEELGHASPAPGLHVRRPSPWTVLWGRRPLCA